MKFLGILAICIGLFSTQSVNAEKAHVHGEAELRILMDKNQTVVTFIAPADSIVGFEHAPMDEDDQDMINEANDALKKDGLFTFYKKKGRFFGKMPIPTRRNTISAKRVAEQKQKKKKHHRGHHHHEHKEIHSEFVYRATYDIPEGTPVVGISTTIFDTFNDLEKIHLTLITETKQSAYVLTPARPEARFTP